ncbi:MAG: GxxExxY protein [Anaerolineae bacterium]|nr:GxxExxY protein [Anaerolineae bacterium]
MTAADLALLNPITHDVIGAAIEVHRQLGPGLLESIYETCLAEELKLRDIPFVRQVRLPVVYKGIELDSEYRVDMVVDHSVAIEIKAIESLQPVHEAQMLTYLKLGKWKLGLLMNFNVPVMKDGIKRLVS